jgi:lipopolysaccharide/colanic/teichoic acid biosynthesis glycosyltransferase
MMNIQLGEARIDYPSYKKARFGSRVSNSAKRVLDVFVCLLSAPFALLIGLPIALAIKLDGGPIFYAQPRVGLNSGEFACLKFRSMVYNADERLKRSATHVVRPVHPRLQPR